MRITTKALGLLASACALTLHGVNAIQANVAGIVDWHQPQLGVSILTPTPPQIVKVPGDDTKGLVVSITHSNVLGAIDEDSGKIVWRHQFEEDDPVISYHISGSNVLLLSGPSGATARSFSLASGHLLWERKLHDARSAVLTTPHYLGTAVTFSEGGDVLVLSEGRKVSRLAAATGASIWQWETDATADSTIFDNLKIHDNSVYVLGLTSSLTAKTLSDITLSYETGQPIGSQKPQSIPSFVKSPDDVTIIVSGNKHVTYVWLENGVVKTFSRAETAGKPRTIESKSSTGSYTKIIKTEEASLLGYIFVQRADGAADILDSRDGKFRIARWFDARSNAAEGEGSVYGAIVSNGQATFTRIDWATSLQLLRVEKIAMAGDAKTTVVISSYTLPFDTKNHGVVLHSSVGSFDHTVSEADPNERPEVAMLGRQHNAPGQRFLLTTSTGASQYWQLGGVKWTREESLADVRAVRFVELGEPEVEDASGIMAAEGFLSRLARHVSELKGLPSYALRFVSRFTSSGYSSLITTRPLSIDKLHRDQFGFQKLVLVATGSGKLFALDSANGNIVWSRLIAFSGPNGSDLDVKAMWNVRDGSSGVGGPVVSILGERITAKGMETVVLNVDAYTGMVDGETAATAGQPLGKVVFSGSHETAFLLPFENCSSKNKVLAIVDRDLQLHMFPKCAKMAKKIAEFGPKLHFSLTRKTANGDSVRGYTLGGGSSALGIFPTVETWAVTLPAGTRITSVKVLPSGAIASFGRVLGDKSTLYKYLNPHLFAITTVADKENRGGVKVVDEASGAIVYEVSIDHIDVAQGVKAHIVENWMVYHWLEPQDGAGNGGWRMASVELYEDRTEDKAQMPGLSALANGHAVLPISQTFVFPGNAIALTTTDSKYGITAKDVIYVNDQHQVATVPRRLLDPRRPTGKPTAGDKEEMLIPYEAVLPPDARRVVSHKYEVLGVKELHTSPALLESTSLLLATGLDLFLTQGVNPSGTFDILSDSFNKLQLILTIIGLTVGISIAGPAVKRKTLRARWY